jgi:quercetin dioxygenase-like cupin family protein
MKIATVVAATSLAITAIVSTTTAQAAEEHTIIQPQEIKWSRGPDVLPPGAEVAVLYGDPSKDGLFSMRLKMPNGYRIPPHTHPKPEVVTVLSGTARLGMGDVADQAKAQVLPAGSFFVMSPGMQHYFSTDEDTVVQINTTGPWGLTYVNPNDDPRKKTQ